MHKIITGNSLDIIPGLDIVDCIITSPPYYKQRDYKCDNQIGQEESPKQYINNLIKVFDLCKKILSNSGSLWVNLGETYRDKSALGIPQRFFCSMIESGWIARNYIIWEKPNPVPSPVSDRLSNVYEPIMFFTKSPHYYFNLDPIRIQSKQDQKDMPPLSNEKPTNQQITLFGKVSQDKRDIVWNAGYNPDDICPFCHQKYIRHVVNRRKSDHSHYIMGFYNCSQNGRNPGDILRLTLQPQRSTHAASFPTTLPTHILKVATKINDTILDPFSGTGTTGIAALSNNRNYIGIELNEEYANISRTNLNKFSNDIIAPN